MADVAKYGGKEGARVFTTLDTEMTLSTTWDHKGLEASWDHEGLEAMCSKDDLWREACERERCTPLKETIENDLDREEEYQRRF